MDLAMSNVILSLHCDAFEEVDINHSRPIEMMSALSEDQLTEERTTVMYTS